MSSSKELFNKTRDSASDDIWDDTLLIKMYEESLLTSPPKNVPKWKVGDKCTAPYAEDDLYYRAIITKIVGNKAFVKYEGYDDDETEIDIAHLSVYQEGELEESSADTTRAIESTSNISASEEFGNATTTDSSNAFLPPFAPPPPPVFSHIGKPDDVEALSSMLMSWYMSGYHTGCYVTMQQMSKQSGNRDD